MFKHATVNQGKPPRDWDFDKFGVTKRFLQVFRQYIPQGKEYDLTRADLKNIAYKIGQQYPTSKLEPSYIEIYDKYVSTVIADALTDNINNLNVYLYTY